MVNRVLQESSLAGHCFTEHQIEKNPSRKKVSFLTLTRNLFPCKSYPLISFLPLEQNRVKVLLFHMTALHFLEDSCHGLLSQALFVKHDPLSSTISHKSWPQGSTIIAALLRILVICQRPCKNVESKKGHPAPDVVHAT